MVPTSAQPIVCPSVPGQSPTPNEDFTTATVSRTVRVEPDSIGTAEVSCPEGTEVTGGGYELREVIPGDSTSFPQINAPTDNGWKVSVRAGGLQGDVFLTVYAVCGALGDITVEICDDGIDNDGDTLVDSADPDCAGPAPPRDTDSDGVRDSIDNCDNVPNPEQEDTDSDGVGDACQDTTEEYTFVKKWGSVCEPRFDDGRCVNPVDGQFSNPTGLAVDSLGFVYVIDYNNNRIQKFTNDGTFVTKWGSQGSADGQLANPNSLAVDSSGFVYVADNNNNRVQKFTTDGEFVASWGGVNNPFGIAVDSSGFVYVTDFLNNDVRKFTNDGTFVTKWGSQGTGDGEFTSPLGIAVDHSGFVYVADRDTHSIQKFTSDGTFVTKWGSQGTGDGQLNNPVEIAVDSFGFVYVTEFFNSRVQKFTNDGTFVTKWGSQGTGDGQFRNPWGIGIDSSGKVFVSDFINNNIQVFERSEP